MAWPIALLAGKVVSAAPMAVTVIDGLHKLSLVVRGSVKDIPVEDAVTTVQGNQVNPAGLERALTMLETAAQSTQTQLAETTVLVTSLAEVVKANGERVQILHGIVIGAAGCAVLSLLLSAIALTLALAR